MKAVGIEIRHPVRCGLRDIAREQFVLERIRHIDAGILQQRGDVIGGGADQCILEIEQADAGDALAGSGSQIRLGE